MNEQDRLWLEKCEENHNYKIFVDNDDIFVVDLKEDDVVHTFSEYGYEFAKSLLQHIGCNVDFV